MQSEFLASLPSSDEVTHFLAEHIRGCAAPPVLSSQHIKSWAMSNGYDLDDQGLNDLIEVAKPVNVLLCTAAFLPFRAQMLTADTWRRLVKPHCPELLYTRHHKAVQRMADFLSLNALSLTPLGSSPSVSRTAASMIQSGMIRMKFEAWERRSDRQIGQAAMRIDITKFKDIWTISDISTQ